ncbi:MAG: alpha/beta fold hydrolase [Planctomycetota bacterium]
MAIDDRFRQLPRSLRERSEKTTLGSVPALVAVPDSDGPVPAVVWMHGRTVDKELDPGRYLRWLRAGIATIALDLPGHGEREGEKLHDPSCTPRVLGEMLDELDGVLDAARASDFAGPIDFDRLGIGGMSAGGMVTLRRLCDPHPFVCAAVESTTGWLEELYSPTLSNTASWPVDHDPAVIERIDAMRHLGGFRPIPLLALHSEADQTVPWPGMRGFLDALGDRYDAEDADRSLIEVTTWPETGAPYEHAGFGGVASKAKDIQTEFLVRHLLGG